MSDFEAYKFTMAKTANTASALTKEAFGESLGSFLSNDNVGKAVKTLATGVSAAVGLSALSSSILSTIMNKINNDTRRKAIIEDLASNDPILKNVDADDLKEWFATMYYYAPTLTADRATVREILSGFARFGRIDMQTLKMLAETEERVAKLKSSGFASFIPKLSV